MVLVIAVTGCLAGAGVCGGAAAIRPDNCGSIYYRDKRLEVQALKPPPS